MFLRIFDDPQEDDKLWSDGGLTFVDPDSKKKLGSNDAAWFCLKDGVPTPLIVVEGTFGTERGQFGDGQFNRFSHPLIPAKLGYIGVMLIPFKGESYSKSDGISGKDTEFASLKYAYLNKTMVKAALGICEKENGNYLFVDFYNLGLLKKLIIQKLKEQLGLENYLVDIIKEVKQIMEDYIDDYSEPRNKISKLYNKNGQIIGTFGYIFTQNYDALTTSSKRDGHGMLGKILTLPYIWPNEKMYTIFLRLDRDKINELKKRSGKEISFVFNNSAMTIVSRDDLEFDDKELQAKLIDIENANLFQERQNELIGKIRDGIESGVIKIIL